MGKEKGGGSNFFSHNAKSEGLSRSELRQKEKVPRKCLSGAVALCTQGAVKICRLCVCTVPKKFYRIGMTRQ